MNTPIQLYIDENISPYLAKGLHILEQGNGKEIEVLSIKDVYGKGALDEDWIPKVGAVGGIVITQDYNIFRKKQQRELYEKCGVGLFFIKPPSNNGYKYWEMVEQVINRWGEIKKLSNNRRPFAFSCTAKGKFERLT